MPLARVVERAGLGRAPGEERNQTLTNAAVHPSRIRIEDVWPSLDCGRFPVKRTLGETVEVWADVIRDGHEQLGAAVRVRRAGADDWAEVPMRHAGNDRWTGTFEVDELGRWSFAVCAWVDRYASWRDEIRRKVEGGQTDLASELAEGSALLGRELATADEALASTESDRSEPASHEPLEVEVDPPLARFGAWYELFPRSWGGFAGVEKILPGLADLGFDVLYLPPIHPIGVSHRKGRNNATTARPDDPGSPWAIGSSLGGHTAVEPGLGTVDDLERLAAAARGHGIELALDFAIQCSPDHPWLEEHPEWFRRRPDGTIKYAENPPKRYQDIVNVDFDTPDREALWEALRDVVLFWVERGVRVFRVDNPHTKPIPFWEWMIREVRGRDPRVIFLAEAFTRPKLMALLAKAGFDQSYTYFTWKNTRHELQEYLRDLTRSTLPQFFRPNFFANTPDILHEYLQHGGRPAFEARLVLAATLSPAYGIYSGFEHFENAPVREGSEEYLDSEKYEVKERRLDGPLLPLVGRLNAIRRENPSLQRLDNVEFLETEQEQLIAYAKHGPGNTVLVCVNLDPVEPREGVVVVPDRLGLPPSFAARDLLADRGHRWRLGRNYVRLEPGQSHLLCVQP
jgi:starch synthase (maltosyl-transferring)